MGAAHAPGVHPSPEEARIPTWIGLLLILGAILRAGRVGLVLERLSVAG